MYVGEGLTGLLEALVAVLAAGDLPLDHERNDLFIELGDDHSGFAVVYREAAHRKTAFEDLVEVLAGCQSLGGSEQRSLGLL